MIRLDSRLALAALILVAFTPGALAQSKIVHESTVAPTARKLKFEPAALTPKACAAFALGLEESFRLNDEKSIRAAIDVDAILDIAQKGIPGSDKTRKTFNDAARAILTGPDGLVAEILGTVKAGGSFRFLRLKEALGATRVVFRLAHLDGTGFDYLEFALAPSKSGGTIANDVWVMSEGGLVSQKLRRFFIALSSESTRNLADKVAAPDKPWVEHAADLAAFDEAFQSGANHKALELCAKLPEALAADESLLLARLRAARSVSAQEFTTALTAARAHRPSDPCTELLAFDAFELARAHDDALHCLDTINMAVGGDSYLDALKGSILFARGDLALARKACKKAVEREPGLEEAWWTLVAITLETSTFDETLTLLKQMDATFDIDWKDLARTPAYKPFFESKFGERWRDHTSAKR